MVVGAAVNSLLSVGRATFVIVEIRTKSPMIDMSLFKDKLFATANAAQLVSFGGCMGLIFLLPLFLQAERGMTPLESGLTTFPQAIGMMLAMPFAGRAYAKYGPRRMMMGGMAVMGIATFGFLFVGLETNAWWIRGLMFVRGPGFAFVLVPLQAATFATIPMERAGRASSVFSAGRQVAGSFGVALLATALANRMAHHGAQLGNPATHASAVLAFHDAFVVAVVLTAVGIAAAFLIDDKAAFAAMGRTPAAAPAGAPPTPEPVRAH